MTARLQFVVWPIALLAGCQPLPHPFADDRPPDALLRVRDVASVSVAPVTGEPAAAAEKLGAAVAQALLKRDIPASSRTASLGSYQLFGKLAKAQPVEGDSTVSVRWRLIDPKGRTVGERTAAAEAAPAEWNAGQDTPVERLAAASAAQLAPLLEGETPVSHAAATAADAGRIRIAIGKIGGAPGDGATSLANAVAAVLKRQDLAIAADGRKADLEIDAEVAVAPATAGKEHVRIVWRVSRADGVQIGTVGQENDVPKGLLDGPWGDLAYSVALAAGDGLMRLVERGAPSPKS